MDQCHSTTVNSPAKLWNGSRHVPSSWTLGIKWFERSFKSIHWRHCFPGPAIPAVITSVLCISSSMSSRTRSSSAMGSRAGATKHSSGGRCFPRLSLETSNKSRHLGYSTHPLKKTRANWIHHDSSSQNQGSRIFDTERWGANLTEMAGQNILYHWKTRSTDAPQTRSGTPGVEHVEHHLTMFYWDLSYITLACPKQKTSKNIIFSTLGWEPAEPQLNQASIFFLVAAAAGPAAQIATQAAFVAAHCCSVELRSWRSTRGLTIQSFKQPNQIQRTLCAGWWLNLSGKCLSTCQHRMECSEKLTTTTKSNMVCPQVFRLDDGKPPIVNYVPCALFQDDKLQVNETSGEEKLNYESPCHLSYLLLQFSHL